MTHNKIKILFMSDWGDTGFGTVGRELCARLASMDTFEVHYLGWHANPNHLEQARSMGIHLHTTQFWTGEDQFGKNSFNAIIDNVKPKVVLTLGDPWMTDHVAVCRARDSFMWLAYVPIDRDVISIPWQSSLRKPDCLVTFSKFGQEIVEQQVPFRAPRLILHGVDKVTFRPWYPEGTNENTDHDELMTKRKGMTLGKEFADKFIVGFVGRNQVRKGIPRVAKAFKAFNCKTWVERQEVNISDPKTGEIAQTMTANEFCRDKQCFRCDVCPAFQQREETEKSIIYLHTTRGDGADVHDRPGIGWRIDEIFYRLDLNGRVAITPGYKALHGLPRAALAQIMNCFDVHCFLSHSEGFGLPIVETLSCGVPTLVTDYSSMPELVSKGGGSTVAVRDYDMFVTWENEWANADIGDAADKINKVFVDKEYAAQMRKDAAANDYAPTWDVVAIQFKDLILEALNKRG